MQLGWQFVIVGIVIAAATVGAFAALAPVRLRLALAQALDGRLPDALVARLRPRGGCGACGGAPRART
jgi:hypothetical protein